MFEKKGIIGKSASASHYVYSGEVKVGTKDELLISSPLGSCIAIVAYDAEKNIGGIAHVMLPGKSPDKNSPDKNKYTVNAIENLLIKLHESGTQYANIEVCLVGGANVLKEEHDTLTCDIIDSVHKTIKESKIKIRASSLGGLIRRNTRLNIETGIVYYTIGEGIEKVLWEFT